MPPPSKDTGAAALVGALSPRRREVLELVAKGLTNADVGRALGISTGTVRTHVAALLQQLQVANRAEAAAAFTAWASQPASIGAVLERPAIAVLPLAPLDGARRTATVAAGFTADLTSLFARWCYFPVIAHASSASLPAGRPAAEAARALGARFVVHGELQPRPGRWRLWLRIDDAATGHCLWIDRRDFADAALFAIQDAVCEKIVAAAYPVLVARAGAGLPAGAHPHDPAAWELAYQGLVLQARREAGDNDRARALLRQALDRDPGLVIAHFGLGLVAYDAALNQWGDTAAALDAMGAAAERCVQLAPHAAEGFFLLGRYFQATGEPSLAVAPLETAVGHNPSFAMAHALLALVLQLSGHSDEAMVRMGHAVRLGPRSFVAGLASLLFSRGEYPEALAAAERAIATNPRYPFARAIAAASAWWAGDRPRATRHLGALLEHSPGFATGRFLETFGGQVQAIGRIGEALEGAGAPA